MRRRSWFLLLPPCAALGIVLLACGGGGGESFGLSRRVVVGPLGFPSGLPDPVPLDRIRAFPNLSFARPVFVTWSPDATDRLFVLEQDGRIHVFPNQDSTTAKSLFLDISSRVSRSHEEEGLLGLAFDPAYAQSGEFYVNYSAANPRRSVVSRFRVADGNPNAADPTSEEVLLTVAQPAGNHNGGWLGFGPDGMLYLSFGDGGGQGDPNGNGQSKGTLLGKILRIDPNGGTPYAIPPDNPFVGEDGARGEIWAYGLRNPWRCAFDPGTGELWTGDVGQDLREEIDVVARGDNLGWDVYEGDVPHQNPQGLPPSAFVPPVLDYDRDGGTTVIGGLICRGDATPSLRGAYVYGDYGSGRVWALVRAGGQLISNEEVAYVPSLSSFGEDAAGELLALSLSGSVWRFRERTPSPVPSFPQRLSDTGLFSNTAGLVAAPGVIGYDVIAPLWSDGAAKRRWIALPGTARIDFDPTGAWTFPVGTVLVKHFEIPLANGTTRRLETRVLLRDLSGWGGFTYRWNDAQTDADLLPGALSESFTVADPTAPGGTREQTWTYPSRTDCLRCHTEASGRVLGVRTLQMNRDFAYPGMVDNQLRSWNHVGLFTTDIGSHLSYDAHADPADETRDVAARARAYLDANCAMCHLPGGPTPVDIDLRSTVPVADMRLVGVRPTSGDLGLPDAWRVLPGDKESSVLWERLRRLDGTRMPPLASSVVDQAAVDLVGEWIDGGP